MLTKLSPFGKHLLFQINENCWTTGYKVFVVYRYVFIETLLCTELLFDFCVFFRGGGGGGYRIGYIVLVVYKCIFIENLLYTQLLFVFCSCIVLFF